jgi:hypothetical protein
VDQQTQKLTNQLAASSRGETVTDIFPPAMNTSAWKVLLALDIAQAILGIAIGFAIPWIVWFQS